MKQSRVFVWSFEIQSQNNLAPFLTLLIFKVNWLHLRADTNVVDWSPALAFGMMTSMLKVYCGSDVEKVRSATLEYVKDEETKGFRVSRIDGENYLDGMVTDALGATSLFGESELYLIDSPKSEAVLHEEVSNNLEAMAESTNIFVIIEGTLLAPEKKKYQKHAEALEEYKSAGQERFNVFSIAEALARKDRKTMWVLLEKARREGIPDEETIGILWWQLKTMKLASMTNSAEEAGVKDYPYKKAKSALNNYPKEKLEETIQRLLTVYHEGHSGQRPLDLALEKFVLTV